MTESRHDIDFDFDFFEEPETREAQPPREPKRGGGPRRPVRPPTGVTPLLRLAGLVAAAILVVVLLVFWVQSCQGASKRSSYEGYMERVGVLAKDSESIGRQLSDELTTPGTKVLDLVPKLGGLVQQQEQDVVSARALEPPGALRFAHQDLIEALELRVNGLRGLRDVLRARGTSKDVAGTSALLASQAQRLVASDVVWDDLFKDISVEELKRQGIGGVAVPDSNFVQNVDFASARSMTLILQRFGGATTGGASGGLHGTGLVSVVAMPANQRLSPTQENTVVATTDLAFAVTVEDTGDAQEVQIKVTLTIEQQPSPIVKTQTIDLINPGEQKTLVFRDLGQVQFATKTELKVDVQPVPNERNTANNSAEYPVIFSLG